MAKQRNVSNVKTKEVPPSHPDATSGWECAPTETKQKRRRDTAYHEAGHAVMARLHGFNVDAVVLCSDWEPTEEEPVKQAGVVYYHDDGEWDESLLALLAGYAAKGIRRRESAFCVAVNMVILGQDGESDFSEAMKVVKGKFPALNDREARNVVIQYVGKAMRMLRRHWKQVDALARTLLKDGIVLP